MEKEVGSKNFDIWLLGDLNPKQWEDILDYPLDPRHPIRHNIWTSIIDVIQDRVYRKIGKRVDSSLIYIRNAVENPDIRPRGNHIDWHADVAIEVDDFQDLLEVYAPKFLFSFGAFSFEFARRSLEQEPARSFSDWSAKRLGEEFRYRVNDFSLSKTNLLPLLHRVVSGGKFVESQDYFCDQPGANYFDFVGIAIANIMLDNENKLPIWI